MAFADPLAFFFTALLGVLVLLYLWERRRQRVVLPSFLLWEEVREDRITASRFRPDLLFFLQALTLGLLILGLAKPYLPSGEVMSQGRRHIVILDTTASMQAREGDGTRFERARQEATQLIDGFPADDEVMLLAAGHSVTVLAEFTRERSRVRDALAQAHPLDAGGDLSLALAFAESARQRTDLPTDILAFTDIARAQLPAALRERVTLFQVGSSDDNVAIESLQIEQGRFQGYAEATAQVQLRNHSAQEAHGMVTIAVEDRVVERYGFTLAPLDSKRILVSGFPRAGRVTATLEPADALGLDNVAYGWIRENTALRVLLVSKPTALVHDLRKLAAASRMQLTVVDASAFAAPAAGTFDLVIFHRVAPPLPPALNALYIFPPPDGSMFASTGEASDLEIVDWNAGHLVLRSLQDLAALPVGRARIVTPPAGSDILLRSRTQEREIPLVFTLEQGGQRVACLTFDLEAQQMLRSDSTSVLLLALNLIDWLAPQSSDTIIARTGEAASLAALPGPLRAVDPHGQPLAVDPAQPIVEPLLAGAYELQGAGGKRVLLANFADPQESNIGRASEALAPPLAEEPAPAPVRIAAPRDEFGSWLLLAATLFLIAEWLLAARRAQGAAN